MQLTKKNHRFSSFFAFFDCKGLFFFQTCNILEMCYEGITCGNYIFSLTLIDFMAIGNLKYYWKEFEEIDFTLV